MASAETYGLPVVLVAHGSRDPVAAATTRALARTVAALRPGLDVRVAFLELAVPRPAQVLEAIGGPAIVVPLLLTKAFHGRVDLPAQVAGFDVTITQPLGEVSEPLLRGLSRRLHEAGSRAVAPRSEERARHSDSANLRHSYDALVLAAAGTRVASARETVHEVAAALGERVGVPVMAAWASAAQPSGAQAVEALRAAGARRVAVASYFLARGQLYNTVVGSAIDAGAVAAAEPLGASWDLARLIVDRTESAPVARPALLAA
jgi:sirohydrochlorin ferrochelatase